MINTATENKSNRSIRPIRTFVRRLGRITIGQKKALAENSQFLIDIKKINQPINFHKIFQLTNNQKINPALDIGFGMGEGTISIALANPQYHFLSVDVHTPGIGRLMSMLSQNNINNVRIIEADVIPLITEHIADNSLQLIKILFPDPWQKTKHHKRRLITEEFLKLLYQKCKAQAKIHIATDFADYANWISDNINKVIAEKLFTKIGTNDINELILPQTKFYKRAVVEGREIFNFYLEK